jgi:sugar phosphate isomerase/epimerase
LDPGELSGSGRQEVKDYVNSFDLQIAALCGEEGVFTDPDTVEQRVERARKLVNLALDLGCPIVTSPIGALADDETDGSWKTAAEALNELGLYATNLDIRWAIDAGDRDPKVLKRFLDRLKTEGIAVNYDPASLIMNGFDHVAAVTTLRSWIVHTHARDGLPAAEEKEAREVPLGEGHVDYPTYLRALSEAGYDGFLTVKRETSDDPITEIGRAIGFLKEQITRIEGLRDIARHKARRYFRD